MFTLFVSLSVIQLCVLIINLLNPAFFSKPITLQQIAIYILLCFVFLNGGLQGFVEGTGQYGTPENWARVAIWATTALTIATRPDRKKMCLTRLCTKIPCVTDTVTDPKSVTCCPLQ